MTISKSVIAARTFNPIRRIVDRLQVTPNPALPLIPLSIGDPTVYGNFKPPANLIEKLSLQLSAGAMHGYPHSCGTPAARAAVAAAASKPNRAALTIDDVILTCGCSQAIDLVITALADPGVHHILLPRPGFSLYASLCVSKGIQFKYYDLLPGSNWEVDLDQLRSLIQPGVTAAVLFNNPSNPCGSNFSETHVKVLAELCEEKHVPIIADEIYAPMVFPGRGSFHSFAAAAKGPVLEVSGLAKRFMVPGWRIGWVVVHDSIPSSLTDIRAGIQDLSTLTLGPSSVLQGVIQHALTETPEEYHTNNLIELAKHSDIIAAGLSDAPGLTVLRADAAMYCLVGIDAAALHVKDDVEFSTRLLSEESVFVLPGQCFQIPNYFRIVITSPVEKLKEACERIKRFCIRQS